MSEIPAEAVQATEHAIEAALRSRPFDPFFKGDEDFARAAIEAAAPFIAEHALRTATREQHEAMIRTITAEAINEERPKLLAAVEQVTDEAVAKRAVAIAEQARAEERARIIADLRRAAAGRREYAQGAPVEARRALLVEAAAFDNAVKLVEGDVLTMTGLLPSWRWTAEEAEFVAQSKGDASDA
ncbi:hypothetical protein [Sphaerimonospora mesophila]|uniref:hypothetical protein n=1 Tax=Sphaerimonospora mesophila TaxID=37483 RepID=UPI0006E2E9FF